MIEFVDYNKPAVKSPYKKPRAVSMEPVIKETSAAIEKLAKMCDEKKFNRRRK